MATHKVLALVGGISKDSLNGHLFEHFKTVASDKMALTSFPIADLPFFSQDIENEPPQVVLDFKGAVKSCDALLFITPEYNRSFPGVLKNALDWGSRPYGQSVWGGKPAGLAGTSPGAIGTFGAQNHLRQVLSFLDIRVMHQPEFYFSYPSATENGALPERSVEFIRMFVDALDRWIAH